MTLTTAAPARLALLLAPLFVAACGSGDSSGGASSTPTPEPTATVPPTATPQPTATLAPTASVSPTSTPTAMASPSPSATPTVQPSPSSTPVVTLTPTPTATPNATPTPTPTVAAVDPTAVWLLNTSRRSAHIFETGSSQGVLEDVQSATRQTVAGAEYVRVEASGVPGYEVTLSQADINALNARPRAATDFASGSTTASAGQVVSFGEDIGYVSSNENCNSTGGYGYWPPGPGCPLDMEKSVFFATAPEPNPGTCEAGLGITGLLVNGTSVFGWGDGQSYQSEGVWENLAPVAEQYDVDICGGHAAAGEYHHHFYTSCLAALVGDDGGGHSPLYGYAIDGYPIYGPYEAAGTLAQSGWAVRDYGAATSAGGCGTPGERSCVLVDEYDLSAGVDSSVRPGPDIGATVSTLSGNSLPADDGFYYQDHYYAGLPVSGARLDQHNGHDTGDGRGYHYHITLSDDGNGTLSPAFPYTVGPRYAGALPDNAASNCGGVGGGGTGGGPGGGAGGGGPGGGGPGGR